MNISTLYIPNEEVYALAAIILLAAIQIIYTLRLKRAIRKAHGDERTDAAPTPSLSVVVYADYDNRMHLNECIPAIMEQNYSDFEVIIINADSSPEVNDIITLLTVRYPKLKSSFVPDSICNVSIRKLSTMLGLKAATKDVAVFTDGNCIPLSSNWLQSIADKFDDETGIVVGYATADLSSDKSFGRRYRIFDKAVEASTYITAAAAGHANRGDRKNIAYRRNLFFENKGFSRTMNLKYGDDDIFVRELGKYARIKPVLTPDSIVREKPVDFAASFTVNKLHRSFTQSKINPGVNKITALIYFFRAIYLLLTLAAIVFAVVNIITEPQNSLHSIIFGSAALAVFIAETITFIAAIRKILKVLMLPNLLASIPVFRELRPFVNIYYKSRSSKIDNYTWE